MVGNRGYTRLVCLALAVAPGWPASAQEEATEERVLGSASALLIERDETGAVPLAAGAKLRKEPHRHAPVVAVVDVDVALPALETRDSWVRVRFGGRVGWAYLGDPPTTLEPSLEPPPPPAPAWPPRDELIADEERLARAVGLLEEHPGPVEVGSFRVYTDVRGERKRQTLFNAARHLDDAYRERYGLSPVREASFAVVVFGREDSYRRFEDSIADLARLDAEGHAGSGVAALVAEKRSPQQAATLLIHELAHLLNRRTFRASLPPWLEEGIANDLAYCRLDRSGRLIPGTLGGKGFLVEVPRPADRFGRRGSSGTFHIEGPLAALSLLQRGVAAGETVPLPELLELTWREFVVPEGRQLRYIESTFLVRYLLDELDGEGFRSFLAGFQAGGDGAASTLLESLGVDWRELSAGFEGWIQQHDGRR